MLQAVSRKATGTSAVMVGVLAMFALDNSLAQNPLRVNIDENTVSIQSADRPILRYRYENVPYKPYLQQLFTPKAINILRDAPHDHLHHHALMFAVAVDGTNFWEEQNAPGRQGHIDFGRLRVDELNDVPRASFCELLDWVDPRTKALLIKERRTIATFLLGEESVSLLTWQSEFELPAGKSSAQVGGSHYFGLGMRFVQSMDSDGTFLNADDKQGKIFRGSERLLRSTWCAYSAEADGKPVTVAMFDCPGNPRHPATWFTMTEPFAYLSATLNLHEQPLEVTSDKPLKLRYGVALWDGVVSKNKIEELYRQWLTLQDTP
ncbi:MAG: PmoA family protein [Phycisphaerales bacterium]|nr:MAG: PmoA family protein [Phycisphaerales bacterium]